MKIFHKEKKANGRRHIYLCGVKVLSYRKHKKLSEFDKVYARRFSPDFSFDDLKYCVLEQFKSVFGYVPDLDHPKTFNEKLTWEKLYYPNPMMHICADKVQARNYFLNLIPKGENYLVKQLGVYDSAEEIDVNKLPDSFVLKSNWGSGCQIIVKDKKKFDLKNATQKMKNWMKKESNHYFSLFEYGYRDIVPKIVAEEFLDFDYKLELFCFNGKPKFFWIVLNDKTPDVKANFYTLDWEKLPIVNHYPNFEQELEKPKYFSEMVKMAEKLSGDFPFVRCDFYKQKDGFKFSELTFYHWGVSEKIEPESYDKWIGDMMILPDKKEKVL